MSAFIGCDDLRAWVKTQGFRIAEDRFAAVGNECNWYAYRRSDLPARECELNKGKKLQLVIKPHEFYRADGSGWSSAEVDVTGEAGGVWFKLAAYSLSPDRLKAELPTIERRLVDAWNALVPKGEA